MDGMESNIKGPAAVVLGLNKMLYDSGQIAEKETLVFNDHPFLRPGTELPVTHVDFVFSAAGMGDFICYMPTMIYMAKTQPWVFGRILCPEFFREFAENIMQEFRQWTIAPNTDMKHDIGHYLCAPNTKVGKPCPHCGEIVMEMKQPFCNGTGGHLVDNGFLLFANVFPTPKDADLYPIIDFDGHVLSEECWDLHDRWRGKYVVFTPGAVSQSRTVAGWMWSPIVHYVKRLGLLPVVLGKSEMSKDLKVTFPDGFPFDQCRDLRDKTTMLEAAFIMKHAGVTLGLDNGLIQLAACTDAAIIAAYNLTEPRERVPHRKDGKLISLSLTQKELACANCQTNIKRAGAHSFARCLYGDLECINILFQNNGERWRRAIDEILKPR